MESQTKDLSGTKYAIYTSCIKTKPNSLDLELDLFFAYNGPDTMSLQDGELL